MALTRSMTARLQAQVLSTETFSTPVKTPRTTSSPRTSASSPSPSPSPRKLPTPPSRPQETFVCEVCRNSINFINSSSSSINSSSSLNNRQISTSYNLNIFSNQIELIINNISKLEESITDHIAISNQLEREIAIISNKLDKLSSSSSHSKPPPTHHNLPRSRPNLPPSRPHLPSPRPNHPPSRLYPPQSRPHPPTTRPQPPPSRPQPPQARPYPPQSHPIPYPSCPNPPPSRPNPPSSRSQPIQSRPYPPQSGPILHPSCPNPPLSRPNPPPSRPYPPPSRPYPPPSRPHSPLSRTNPPPSLSPDTRHHSPLRRSPLPPSLSSSSFPPLSRSPPHSHINHNIVSRGYRSSNVTSSSSKPSFLILGDSNTKHIRLPLNFHRIPTYTIEDIDPSVCIGYTKVWIHVGINSLKSIRCGGPSDVRKHFDLFMSKIERIGMLSPNTTVIVSPILPTAIKVLNDRACYFNMLLFSINRWWLELDFSIFADDNNMLRNFYRCYNNPMDKIHLGSKGRRELESMILKRTSLVDTRSYSSVVRS